MIKVSAHHFRGRGFSSETNNSHEKDNDNVYVVAAAAYTFTFTFTACNSAEEPVIAQPDGQTTPMTRAATIENFAR